MTDKTAEMTVIDGEKKTYRTLSDILDMRGAEAMPLIARIAPSIETIARKSGIFELLFSDTVVKATNPVFQKNATAKQKEQNAADMRKLGEQVTLKVLRYALGECLPEVQEIIAAVNGMSRDELLEKYTTREIVEMVKAIFGDDGFLSSARTFVG